MDQTISLGTTIPAGFEDVLSFPLSQAIFGRRARRFSLGSKIPDGPLEFESLHEPMPLSMLEQILVLTAAGGNTGWHYAITRNQTYAPHLANYAGAAGGRTFPSAAGFHTSELFFTDDDGVYMFATRDAPALSPRAADGTMELPELLAAHKSRIRKLADGRMNIPPEEPFMEGHNTWCANRPGSTFIMPIADLAQHAIAMLCFLVQNGACITDDINGRPIPGIERFKDLVNVDEPFPLSYFDQYALTEATAELATSCYAGMLMLQAMGLGGWMYDGIDRHTIFGATGDPNVPGLGFRYDEDERWSLPNATGIPGVFEGFCPPHYPDMRAAVEAFTERKFGEGGPFNAKTPGPWKESARVRSSALVHSEEFKDCVATMAQYVYDTFGKFPA
ncbi:MAG TPA: hypothetical protein VFS18_04490, partial [Actinomycetota bacterium]|nr:hypothetical protein [Actinomycetota bacterium]